MSTADSRWCSVCLRWLLRLPGTGLYWTNDSSGAWVCPTCSRRIT